MSERVVDAGNVPFAEMTNEFAEDDPLINFDMSVPVWSLPGDQVGTAVVGKFDGKVTVIIVPPVVGEVPVLNVSLKAFMPPVREVVDAPVPAACTVNYCRRRMRISEANLPEVTPNWLFTFKCGVPSPYR